MNNLAKRMSIAFLAAVFACSLTACGNSEKSEASPSAESAAEEPAVTGEDVKEVLSKALEADYDNLTYTMETNLSATGATSQGTLERQTTTTIMKGELRKAGESPAMHINYKASSNIELGVTLYDMYVDEENGMIVEQNGQLFVEDIGENGTEDYIQSITSVISKEEIDSLIDMSSRFTIEQDGTNTVVTFTVDPSKLEDTSEVDTSSMPEGTSIATLIASYTIDSNDRFTTVHLMSSTSGSPTYHVRQTYRFEKYNETELPEWPDLKAYMMEMSGIQIDEFGNMYIDEDGVRYYIDSIDDDGTINFRQTETYDDTTYYYYDDSDATESGTTDSESAGGGEGRPYITDESGQRIYLDDEGLAEVGGRLVSSGEGSYVLITDDGGFYYLGEVDL